MAKAVQRAVRCIGVPFQTPNKGDLIIADTKYDGKVLGRFKLDRWKYDGKHYFERKRLITFDKHIPWRQVVAWEK